MNTAEKPGGRDIKDFKVHIEPELEDIVPDFLNNIRKNTEDIGNLLAEGKMEEVRVIGHSMKGSGGSYGFDEISRIGKKIEDAAKAGNKRDIAELNNGLAEYLSAVKVLRR